MSLTGALSLLLASLGPLLSPPMKGPAGMLVFEPPPGWSSTYRGRELRLESPDGEAELVVRLEPKREAPPTDDELLRLWGFDDAEIETPLVVRERGGFYLRRASTSDARRYRRAAALYAARWLWLWSLEGPRERLTELSFWDTRALASCRCLLPTVEARRPQDFGDELSLRLGPGFRLGLPEGWRVMSRVSYDFLALFQRYGHTVADISVLTAGAAAGRDDRALFLESLLLDVQAKLPGFRLLSSTPTVIEGFPAQSMEGRYIVDGVGIRWFCAVLFGGRGTYAVTGQCAGENRKAFQPLFERVVASLREGALTPWYEELWDYLTDHVTTLLIPLVIAVLAGTYFALHGLQRLMIYIGLVRNRRHRSKKKRKINDPG
jgi:hypothetical protein